MLASMVDQRKRAIATGASGITTPSRQNLILAPVRSSVEEEVLQSSVRSSERKGRHSDLMGGLV